MNETQVDVDSTLAVNVFDRVCVTTVSANVCHLEQCSLVQKFRKTFTFDIVSYTVFHRSEKWSDSQDRYDQIQAETRTVVSKFEPKGAVHVEMDSYLHLSLSSAAYFRYLTLESKAIAFLIVTIFRVHCNFNQYHTLTMYEIK